MSAAAMHTRTTVLHSFGLESVGDSEPVSPQRKTAQDMRYELNPNEWYQKEWIQRLARDGATSPAVDGSR